MASMFSFIDGVPVGGGGTFTGGTVTTAINFSGLATDITTPGVEDLTISPGGLVLVTKQVMSSITFTGIGASARRFELGATGLSMGNSGIVSWAPALQYSNSGDVMNVKDTVLLRGGIGIVSQRNGVNSQAHHLFNTWTDASNYERFAIDWQTTANVLRLATEAAGTGTVRDIALMGGDVGIGRTTPNAKLDVDQASATGAIPVLTLRQADVDEDFLQVIGTSDTNVDRALVDAVDFTTIGALAGYLKIRVQDDQATNPIPDGDYYLAFYAAPSA